VIKFKKGTTFTDVTTYKRFVGGVWQDILTGKRKNSGGTWTTYWKIPSQTFVSGNTVQIYVTKVNGDMEAQASSATNTWLNLYPGSITYQWWAENSTSVRRALFKFTLKDQDNRTVEWWADCTNNGPTVIYHSDPTVGGGDGDGGTEYPPSEGL